MKKDEVEAAKKMRAAGMTWQAVADTIGVDQSTLFNQIPDRIGYRHKVTAGDLAAVRASVALGETIKDAARFGLNYSSVRSRSRAQRVGEPVPEQDGGWRPGSGRKPSA
jgi:fructose-1-phosphate kinase PfkB-like protein